MIGMKWMAAVALLSMSAGALASGTYEFDSITSLNNTGGTVTGVLVNDTVPTTLPVGGGTNAQCFSWLQLMMKRPGKFTITVTTVTSGGFPGIPPQDSITACVLTSKP